MEINPIRAANLNLHYGFGGIVRYVLSRLYTITKEKISHPFLGSDFLSEIYQLSKNIIESKINVDCIETYIEYILFYESKQQIDSSSIYDIDYPKMYDMKNKKFYRNKNILLKDVIGFGIELILADV